MKKSNYLLVCFLLALFTSILLHNITLRSLSSKLTRSYIQEDEFRAHEFNEELISLLKTQSPSQRGELAGLYLLQHSTNFDENPFSKNENWDFYINCCNAIWQDITYFPIPISSSHEEYQVSFEDSWMTERTYGGKRGHEGTDLIASKDIPGLYPVLSMTDGVIEQIGWLEKGGYRVGVQSPSGGYFYYAHLDSYGNIEEGMEIPAGYILGFMGNSGYGKEGTKGMFVTHLHLGIYLYENDAEISINPYWILKMIEEKRLSCSF